MLSREVLKHWLWDTYDNMFLLVMGNVIVFVLMNVVIILGAPFFSVFIESLSPPLAILALFVGFVILTPVVLMLAVAPAGNAAAIISREKEPVFRDLVAGIRLLGFRVWKFFFVVCLLLGVLVVNAWFYLFSGWFPPGMQLIGGLLAGLCIWVSVTILCALQIALPVYLRRETGIFEAFRRGVIALLKYPGLMIGNGIFLISLGILSILAMFAPILLYGFFGPVLLCNAMYDVLMEHEEKESAPERPAPKSWAEREEREKEEERIRMRKIRYNRTLRDLLRPWQDS